MGPGRNPQLGIEVRQRLIHEKHRGLTHNRACEGDALTLPTGEFGGTAVQKIVEFYQSAGATHLFVMPARVDAAHLQGEADVLVDGHVRIEGVGLEHHGHVAVLGLEAVDNLSIEGDGAFADILKAGDHTHSCGLAAPGRPKQDEEFLVSHCQIEVFDTNEAAPALTDFAEFNFCHCRPGRLCLDRGGRLDCSLFSR